ncbi:hypothetical protein BDR26DRAFT_851605 [Obelidium mucronatum]|nr:hypothetical protein BDR26DRAFT_851605 [Obelidium mucronatum]
MSLSPPKHNNHERSTSCPTTVQKVISFSVEELGLQESALLKRSRGNTQDPYQSSTTLHDSDATVRPVSLGKLVADQTTIWCRFKTIQRAFSRTFKKTDPNESGSMEDTTTPKEYRNPPKHQGITTGALLSSTYKESDTAMQAFNDPSTIDSCTKHPGSLRDSGLRRRITRTRINARPTSLLISTNFGDVVIGTPPSHLSRSSSGQDFGLMAKQQSELSLVNSDTDNKSYRSSHTPNLGPIQTMLTSAPLSEDMDTFFKELEDMIVTSDRGPDMVSPVNSLQSHTSKYLPEMTNS